MPVLKQSTELQSHNRSGKEVQNGSTRKTKFDAICEYCASVAALEAMLVVPVGEGAALQLVDEQVRFAADGM